MTYAFNNITVHLSGSPIVKEASSELTAGKITVIVGPNGAGKTTLLTALAGLRPSTGTMSAEGKDLSRQERRTLAAYMPQDIGAQSSLTLLEVVLLSRLTSLGLRVPADLQAAAVHALDRFGLAALQERTLDAVSGGQRQLVYLTQALFREPSLLLLDEPTASLDLRHQLIVMDAVRAHAAEHKIAVLIAIHDLSLAAQFADQVICLAGGRIEADGPADQVLTSDRLRALFGVEAEVDKAPSGHLRITPVKAVEERSA
ncbi:MAG: ABC transporter ATP-binding protein [Pseudomonadota bacterium]